MEQTNLSFSKKLNWVIRLTSVFWIMAKLISCKLWLADRLFPLVPPFEFLTAPSIAHTILYVISLALLGLLIFIPQNKWLLIVVVSVELVSCLFDQNRWQPWEYQYIITLLVILFNYKNEKNILSLIIFIMAGTYFYSGLTKVNPVFLQSIWNNLLLSKTFGLSYQTTHQWWVYNAGYLIGIIELIFAVGLFFKATFRAATYLLVAMHIIIIGVFGPFGLNYDHVVWPWNLTMLSYLFILILFNSGFTFSMSFLHLKRNWPVVILFGIMPLFSLWGKWDFFLSSSLFSSRPTDMYVCLPQNSDSALLKFSVPNQSPCGDSSVVLNIRTWAFEEMGAPAYPQTRVYNVIQNKLQKTYPDLQAVYYKYEYKGGKKRKMEMR